MKKPRKYLLRFMFGLILLSTFGISEAGSMKRAIVIEGIGGALSARFLAPAMLDLQLLDDPQIEFYGTELNYNNLTDNGKQTVQTLIAKGMRFIDKSNPEHLSLYRSIAPDYVFLSTPPATHIPLVKEWLAHNNPPRAILVEKPFTENISELEEFINYTKQYAPIRSKVLAFDFAEVAFALTDESVQKISRELDGVENIQIFMMDNNSGEILDNPLLLTHDDRPISRENRVALLQEGMVLDQMVHAFPPLYNIVDLNTAEITDIKAAQYANAEIRGETFVAARILASSKANHKPIAITAYHGKGIGKISTWNMTDSLKLLMILRGGNGKQVWLNLNDSTGKYIDVTGSITGTYNLPKNYHAVIENLFVGNAEMGQSIEAVLVNLKLATKIKQLIHQHAEQNGFTTYAVGCKKTPAPTLEEILATTPRLYGDGPDRISEDLTA